MTNIDYVELFRKHAHSIGVIYVDYVPVDDAISDASTITIILPKAMISDYSKAKYGNPSRKPEPAIFARDMDILARLKEIPPSKIKGVQPGVDSLEDALEFIGDDFLTEFREGAVLEGMIGLVVQENPEMHDE